MIIIETEWRAQLERLRDGLVKHYVTLQCTAHWHPGSDVKFEWIAYHGKMGAGPLEVTADSAIDGLLNKYSVNLDSKIAELREQLANMERLACSLKFEPEKAEGV